jgi:hypothetical protein
VGFGEPNSFFVGINLKIGRLLYFYLKYFMGGFRVKLAVEFLLVLVAYAKSVECDTGYHLANSVFKVVCKSNHHGCEDFDRVNRSCNGCNVIYKRFHKGVLAREFYCAVKPEFFFPCLISAILLISYIMCCPCSICRFFSCSSKKMGKPVVGKTKIGEYAAPADQAEGMALPDAAETPKDVCFKDEFYQDTGQSQGQHANGVQYPQSEVSWDRLSREISESIKSGDSDE